MPSFVIIMSKIYGLCQIFVIFGGGSTCLAWIQVKHVHRLDRQYHTNQLATCLFVVFIILQICCAARLLKLWSGCVVPNGCVSYYFSFCTYMRQEIATSVPDLLKILIFLFKNKQSNKKAVPFWKRVTLSLRCTLNKLCPVAVMPGNLVQ